MRELLHRLTRCTHVSMGIATFQGSLGLAEDWIDHKLGPRGQRWVSACLLARVNLHDNHGGDLAARPPQQPHGQR